MDQSNDQPYLGELRAIAFRTVPQGWARCEGQPLLIAQYPQLYNVLGTTFGGDGQTTFRLPDLRGRVPIGAGQAPDLSSYALGALGGAEAVALRSAQMPAHGHAFTATLQTGQSANDSSPKQNYLSPGTDGFNQYSAGPKDAVMGPAAGVSGQTDKAGGSQPHDNRQPWLATCYMIATAGRYPDLS